MLALVVANDLSVLEHIFCENQLCNDMIVDILDTNFVTWAWDITSDVNKRRYRVNITFKQPNRCVSTRKTVCRNVCWLRRFAGMCSTTDLGRKVLPSINSADSNDFPLVFVISRVRGSAQIMGVVKG